MAKKIKVLVVDDAAFTRDLIKKGVRSQFPGFTVQEATNGREAQRHLGDGGYDLVLCDWEMPEMGGDELLAWMRNEEATAKTPFVMVTSRGEKEHVVKAVELGVTNYLVKPFTTEKLTDVVTRALTKATGLSAQALHEAGGAKSPATGNDSASILTQGPRKQGGASGRSAGAFAGDLPIAEATTPTETPQRAVPKGKVIAQIRFGSQTTSCLIKELDQERLVGVIRRGDTLPTLLEMATFDFATEDEQVSRINAYIEGLKAREDRQETDFINITLRFIDDDPQKREQLGRYIASIA